MTPERKSEIESLASRMGNFVAAPALRELLAEVDRADASGYARGRAEAVEECAKIAEWAHMVEPDGGSPTTDEQAVAEEAARRIRALLDKAERG